MDQRLREVTELVLEEFEVHISPEQLLERAPHSADMARLRDVANALAHETGALAWVPGARVVLQRCTQHRARTAQFDKRSGLARFRLIDRFWQLPK